ncbi:MAG: histidinol dehydrogenase [Actinomycetota bacterium]
MLRLLDVRRGDPRPEPASAGLSPEVVEAARGICERVRREGDRALVELTLRHDGADVEGRLEVVPEELQAASPPAEVARAIDGMAVRLRDLHARQLPRPWSAEAGGLRFGEVVLPLRSVGCYAPGGLAAYPSTVLMTAIPARVAGVERVVLCTPPAEDGTVSESVRYAARVAGVDAVYRIGGAQAIAAMAYGTETIERVDKVVGPGNEYVTAAKHEVGAVVGIDMLAGPTELVIVAGASADPAVLAVDLVAQAEHDPQARTTLIALDESLPDRVERSLEAEVEKSTRREIVEASLAASSVVVVRDEAQAADIADALAPEHLQVITDDPRGFLDRVRAFGAAFLGSRTAVTLGDYGAGSNHVLPTMTTARFQSGLRATDFVTARSVVEASPEAAAALGPEVEAIARAEGLDGHARASEVRR